MSTDSVSEADPLKSLHKIAEEIPSGVSEKAMKTKLQLTYTDELRTITNAFIVTTLQEQMNRFWSMNNVPENMQRLKELEKDAHANEVAWRPTTGEVNINPILFKVLSERKNRLEEEINKVREQSDNLRVQLKDTKEKLKKQMKEMLVIEDNDCKNSAILEKEVTSP